MMVCHLEVHRRLIALAARKRKHKTQNTKRRPKRNRDGTHSNAANAMTVDKRNSKRKHNQTQTRKRKRRQLKVCSLPSPHQMKLITAVNITEFTQVTPLMYALTCMQSGKHGKPDQHCALTCFTAEPQEKSVNTQSLQPMRVRWIPRPGQASHSLIHSFTPSLSMLMPPWVHHRLVEAALRCPNHWTHDGLPS